MKKRQTMGFLQGLLLSIVLLGFNTYAQDDIDLSKYNRLIDLVDCKLKVQTVEKAENVILSDGTRISASRKDAQLLLVRLKGEAPDYGKLSLNPSLFAVNYIHMEKLSLSLAKATGHRGTTPEGKEVDLWYGKPEDSYNLVMEKKGSEVDFWIAVEVPKAIEQFFIRIPSQINGAVKNIR